MALSYAGVVAADSPYYNNRGATGWATNGSSIYPSATPVNGPTHAQDGQLGNHFNGGCVIGTGVASPLGGAHPFAIEFWWQHRTVDADNRSESGSMVATGDQNTNNIWIATDASQNWIGGILTEGGDTAPDVWHHYVFSYDGLNYMQVIDGIVTAVGTQASMGEGAAGADVYFGADAFGSYNVGFIGCLAEIAMYDHSLTFEQMLRHYAAMVVDQTIPAAGSYTDPHALALMADSPLAYYRCNEATGSWAADCSGNDHAGAYKGWQANGVTHGEPSLMGSSPDASVLLDGISGALLTPFRDPTWTQFTLECIVYPTGLGPILNTGSETSSPPPLELNIKTSTDLFYEMVDSFHGDVAILADARVHVVLTWDGTTCTLYINGEKVASGPNGPMQRGGNTLAFGLATGGGSGNYLACNLDEVAIYTHALLANRVLIHYQTIDGLPPAVPIGGIAEDDQHYWELRIYDKTGNLVELPIDVEELTMARALNGGPQSNATIVLRRPFNDIGPGPVFQNRVLFWFWNGQVRRPTDPWWSGYIMDIDQSKQKTEGKITLHCTGDMTLLDAAIVTETINPGIGGNPQLDAMDYIRYLMATYAPPAFGTVTLPPSGFNTGPQQFSAQTLDSVIDTILKQGRSDDGLLFNWAVIGHYDLTRELLIQPDQDPNTIVTVPWKWVWVEGGASQYDLQTKYSGIYNVILVNGGQDSVTGQQISAVYEDAESIAAYGPIEGSVSVPEICSYDAALAYGEAYLDINGNPQAQGTVVVTVPDPSIVEGTWIRFWEAPGIIKEMRATTVEIKLAKGRITQTISPTAPVPYLDAAIYVMGQRSQQKAISQVRLLPVNLQTLYVRGGGVVTI